MRTPAMAAVSAGSGCELCAVGNCQVPAIVPAMAPDGRWVTVPANSKEMDLLRREQLLDLMVEFRELRHDLELKDVEPGRYYCFECKVISDGETEFVEHLRVEKGNLEGKREELLMARQQLPGGFFP